MRTRQPGRHWPALRVRNSFMPKRNGLEEIKYKLAWTNPAFLCSADHGRNCIGYQKNLQCKR